VPATLLSISLLRRMRQGFQQAQASAQSIAKGDLSQQVRASGKDEISDLLGHMEDMRAHLHQIIAQVRSGADAIAGASTQVAAGTQDLSSRTEQQAASLEQTAAATEQLSSTVQHNADSAVRASELASTATDVAQRGGAMVGQVVQTMEDINTSSRKIEDIIAVIDGIAFQTNILALNAAVEAARAGEQGRGFAVVAGEVRSLAGRSAEAAKEVKTLITASVDRVRVGSEQVHRTGATMQDIVSGIQRGRHRGRDAEASREQSRRLEQINLAVANLDDVTQQNAALVEDIGRFLFAAGAGAPAGRHGRQVRAAGGAVGYARPAVDAGPRGPASLGGGGGGPVAAPRSQPQPRATPSSAKRRRPWCKGCGKLLQPRPVRGFLLSALRQRRSYKKEAPVPRKACRAGTIRAFFAGRSRRPTRWQIWHATKRMANKVLMLVRSGNTDAAVAQIKVAPTVGDVTRLQALLEQLPSRLPCASCSSLEEERAMLAAPRLHRAP
jgi:ABC-type transporter Mla subunit MlaD